MRSGSLWLRNRVIVQKDAVDHWIWIQISDDISGTESFSEIRMILCAEFRCEIEEYLLRKGFVFKAEEKCQEEEREAKD